MQHPPGRFRGAVALMSGPEQTKVKSDLSDDSPLVRRIKSLGGNKADELFVIVLCFSRNSGKKMASPSGFEPELPG